MPATIKFSAGDPLFSSNCADLIKYSDNTYLIELKAKSSGLYGFFEPVSQIKFKQANIIHTVTLFFDGIYYIELENENSILKKKLPDGLKDVTLAAETVNTNSLAAIYAKADGKKYCLLIGYNYDYKILGEYYADNVKTEDKKLVITRSFNDMCRHNEELFLDYDGTSLKTADRKIKIIKPPVKKDKLIPYYFLEALMSEFYDEALKMLEPNHYKDITSVQLKNFFDNFYDITQNHYEEKYAEYVALKQKVSDSYYELKYYNFVVKDGLIENIMSVE